jgi:AcrR family transcriptional regulator
MRETNLEKGGIYNHFSSKEQLSLEAFDYACGLVRQRMNQALVGKRNAIERLLATVTVFQGIVEDPPLAGGCPILNLAIEADDSNELLRARARAAMDDWRTTIERIVHKGIERQEILPDTNADEVASILIATLEGGVMLSNLYKDPRHIQRTADHSVRYIKTIGFSSSHV